MEKIPTNDERILSFEFNKEMEVLEIHCNSDGLEYLESLLKHLKSQDDLPEHIHLMSPDWCGCDMSSGKIGDDNEKIHHVKIFKWKD